jgi:hypothetical protein
MRPAGDLAVRLAAASGVALAVVVLTGAPAQAHGPAPDASNYLSSVDATVSMVDGEPAGEVVAPAGVTWRVLGADALLQVENTSNDDLVVAGYEGEPFLRIGPQGVFQNARSPATYLNADRFGMTEAPPAADPAAAPDWEQISTASRWQWHDHRIHWMARTTPPQVQRRPGVTQTLFEWSVPFGVAGQDLAVQGVLRWIPPTPAWPWVAGATVVASLPVLLLALRRGDQLRAVRASIVFVAVVAAACVTVAVGDVLASPASGVANVWAVAQTLVPSALAVVLAGSLWRGEPANARSGWTGSLLIAAAVLAFGCGLARASQLQSSQIVNVLPSWVVRSVVAASLAAVISALLVMLVVSRTSGRGREATLVPDAAEAQ